DLPDRSSGGRPRRRAQLRDRRVHRERSMGTCRAGCLRRAGAIRRARTRLTSLDRLDSRQARDGGRLVTDLPYVAQVEPQDNHVALKVKALEASVRFYQDLMGLPILRTFGPTDNPRAVFVSGIQLVRQSGDPGPNPYGIFDHVGIAVANIAEVCARLDA